MEYNNGLSTCVYNEVYRWLIDRNEWKLIESLNTPLPRCSHQAVYYKVSFVFDKLYHDYIPINQLFVNLSTYLSKDKIYIFGGEYATLDQFYHYK